MDQLSHPYPYEDNDPGSTKSKILVESARLFALRGYDRVSTKDIGRAAGITPGAIYAHFSGKQEILEQMLARCGRELRKFYGELDGLSARAGSFEEILDNIYIEIREPANPFSYYSVWCAMNTQFELEASRHLFYDIWFVEGHAAMRRQMQIAIDRGLAPPFDVGEVASLITNSFMMMVGLHVGRLNGYYPEFQPAEWYGRQIGHILRTVTGESR